MTVEVNGSCRFEFDVPDYEEAFPWLTDRPPWGLETDETGVAGPGVHEGTWHCPHDALEGYEYCPFHLDPDERSSAGVDICTRFVRTVKAANRKTDPTERKRYCQFVGGRFSRFDLECEVVGGASRETIDFRHATFGVIACEKTRFQQPVDFSGAVFDPGPSPSPAPGREVLDPALSKVPFGIDFTHTTFADVVNFDSAVFRRPALFRDAEFSHPASFKYARFLDHVSFLTADFEDIAMFNDTLFDRDARFQACELVDLADFKRSYVGGRLSFDRAICNGDIELDDADLTTPPPCDAGSVTPSTFDGTVTADKAVVTGRLSFNGITFDGEIRIRDADVAKLRLGSPTTRGGTSYVDLAQSTIECGTLDQPPSETGASGEIVYDLYRATVGNVRFGGNTGGGASDNVRFLRTEYDGFDFTDNDAIDLNRTNHWIHRFEVAPMSVPCYCADGEEHVGRFIVDDAVCPRHDRKPDYAALQATYAYAKNGADDAGDNASAGAFFYREMYFHRQEYLHNIVDTGAKRGFVGRLLDGTRWFRSWLLAITTGYGEHPYRVVVSSLAIVLGFGYVYWNNSLFNTEYSATEALVFSFQSFITFVLGPPESATLSGEALSAVQGFIGAFLIALFVFTFTRRIHR